MLMTLKPTSEFARCPVVENLFYIAWEGIPGARKLQLPGGGIATKCLPEPQRHVKYWFFWALSSLAEVLAIILRTAGAFRGKFSIRSTSDVVLSRPSNRLVKDPTTLGLYTSL